MCAGPYARSPYAGISNLWWTSSSTPITASAWIRRWDAEEDARISFLLIALFVDLVCFPVLAKIAPAVCWCPVPSSRVASLVENLFLDICRWTLLLSGLSSSQMLGATFLFVFERGIAVCALFMYMCNNVPS